MNGLQRRSPVVSAALGLLLCGSWACGGAPAKPHRRVRKAQVPPPGTSDRPAVVPAQDAEFPLPKRFRVASEPAFTDSGVHLLVVERDALPVLFVRWVFPGGRVVEFAGGKGPRWPEGTVDLTADMLTEGTRRHHGTDFAAALQSHGAELSFSVRSDAVVATGQALAGEVGPFLSLIKEALLEPEFGARALSSLKKRYRAHLTNLATRPRSIGARIFNRVVYGADHPYGSPGPTLRSVDRIAARHLRAARRAALRLAGSTLIVVGDVRAEALVAMLRTTFGKALDGKPDPATTAPPPRPEPAACHVIEVPGAVQTVILHGNPGPARGDEHFAAVRLANQVLGGSASSRLFTVLRERKGLTYGIYSSLDGRRVAGDWSLVASVRTPKTAEALGAIHQELALIRSQEPRPEELAAARRKLAGSFLMSLARGGAVAARLAAEALYGLPEGYWSRYVGELNAVSADAARARAARFFGVGARATVLVGNIEAIRPAIDRYCPRIIERDATGKVLLTVLGDDDAMTVADRAKLFELWASSDAGFEPMRLFVADTRHSRSIRADALAALLETGRHHKLREIGAAAKDWNKLVVEVVDRLVAAFKLRDSKHDLDRAFAAHAVLLDILDPPDRDKTVLAPELELASLKALADWAFAGVDHDTPTEDVRRIVKLRLVPSDLVRLGEPAIRGLEAMVSTSVMRVEAGRALRDLETGEAGRALLRGYRRALIERRSLPDDMDMELLGSLREFATVLLLFDCHALLQPADTADKAAAAARVMDTLRRLFDDLAAAKSHEPRDRGHARTVLQREFPRFIRSLEAVLAFANADDRWWAATQLIRHKGLIGLRLVLRGLKDDVNYSDPAHHTVDPKLQIGDLCRNEIAPLGLRKVQHILMAALSGRHGVAKVIAVTALKAFGDKGSMTALRTHRDDTDVAPILGLPGRVPVTRLAEAAVDVNRYMDEIDEAQEAGRVSEQLAELHKELAYYTYDLTGKKLRAEVARRVRERLPARIDRPPSAPAAKTSGSGGKSP